MSDTSDEELPPLAPLIFAPRPRAAQGSRIDRHRPNSRASSTKPESLAPAEDTEPNGNLKARLFKVLLEVFIPIYELFSKIGVVLLWVQFFFVACFLIFLGYCAIADRCTILDVYTVRLGTALTAVFEHLHEAYNTVSVGLCEASQLARGSDTAVCLVRNTEARQAMQELGQQLRWAWEAFVIQTVIYGQRLQIAAT